MVSTKPNASDTDYDIPASFSDTETKTRPDASKLTEGFTLKEKPNRFNFNWFWDFIVRWFTYCDAAIDEKQDIITGGASTVTSTDLTASRALVSNSSGKISVSTITSTILGYLANVTSDIQTQINNKQTTITGGATTIDTENLTASRVLVSDGSGKVAVSSITSTILGYLTGVTSNIQTQLNAKEATITKLTIAKGGTNSSTALNNNRVMKSSGGTIIEAAAITANKALISDANGIPTHSAVSNTTLAFLDATSSVQTQLNLIKSYLIVQDVKNDEVAGGNAVAGDWYKRDLTTVKYNGITGSSLASNQITLPAGTYKCDISSPFADAVGAKIRLQNITSGTTISVGSNCDLNNDTDSVSSLSIIKDVFVLTGSTILEIQYRVAENGSSDGGDLGNACSFGVDEVYTIAEFQKIA